MLLVLEQQVTLHRGQSIPAMGHKARAQEPMTRRSTSKEGVAEGELPTGGAGGPWRTGRSQSSIAEGHTGAVVLRAGPQGTREGTFLPSSVLTRPLVGNARA